ncbi:MAG: hypothetical protein NVSMB9_10110 [Isosphaeraceae bacterium]
MSSRITFQECIVIDVRGLIGAAVRGTLGDLVFFWVMRQGYDVLILPGAWLGLCRGRQTRDPPRRRGMFRGLFTAGNYERINKNDSLLYLITQLKQLPPFTLFGVGKGSFISYALGKEWGEGRH